MSSDVQTYPGTPGFLLCQALDTTGTPHLYMVVYAGTPSSSTNGYDYASSLGCSYAGLVKFSDLVNAGFDPYDYLVYVNQVGVSIVPQDDASAQPITTISQLMFTMNDPFSLNSLQLSIDTSSDTVSSLVWVPMPGSIQAPTPNVQAEPGSPDTTNTLFYLVSTDSNYEGNGTNTQGVDLCPFATKYALIGVFNLNLMAYVPSWDSLGRGTLAPGIIVPPNGNNPVWTGLNLPGNSSTGPNYFAFGFVPAYQMLTPCMCDTTVPCSFPYAPFAPGSPWLDYMVGNDSTLYIPNYDGSDALILGGTCSLTDPNPNPTVLYTYYASEFCGDYCTQCTSGSTEALFGERSDKVRKNERCRQSSCSKKKRRSGRTKERWIALIVALSAAVVVGLIVFAVAYGLKPVSRQITQ